VRMDTPARFCVGLVCPAAERYRITRAGQRPRENKILRTNRISLLAVAAATPEGYEIEFIDEHVEAIDFDKHYDVVGVSFMTGFATRAYEIGDQFRQRGITVVFGGYHPTFLPEEAIRHCDAVCIGEAELVWPRILRDAASRKLAQFYKADRPVSMGKLHFLRRDLLKQGSYFTTNLVLVGRGCPRTCDFCSVTQFFENTYRYRPVTDVVAEVASLKGRLVLFGDDNIFAHAPFAKELFRELIPLRKSWMSQGNLSIAEDAELLDLAQRSGCKGLFIGLESLSNPNLKDIGKGFYNAERYRELIARLSDHGIAVMAGFMFGFDHDEKSVFEKTAAFINDAKLIAAQIAIVTPFPGTRFYDRLEAEARIFDHDWAKYDFRNVVFQPKHMTPQELQDGVSALIREVYGYPSIAKRMLRMTRTWGITDTLHVALPLNLGYRWSLSAPADASVN
jgi:radical SAM superfamily enzyme YgiQ (UPF0313 family)